MRYELTDFEWAAIKPFLPNKPRGVPRVNDRRVLNGIFWVLRSGAPWRASTSSTWRSRTSITAAPSSHQFLLCERERVKKGLHRGLAEAPAALVRPLLVVVDEPGIEIGLQFLDRAIDLFAERHPVELVEQRAMEALTDAVGLRALGLGAAVIDVLDRQVELVLVAFPAAELGAAIGQHPA